MKETFEKAKRAAWILNTLGEDVINTILTDTADLLEKETEGILQANRKDLSRMSSSDPKYDRLLLSGQRIQDIARDMRNVAGLPSPLGRILSEKVRLNGMRIRKISVPFGVVGVIYEARPNVTADVFSLCLKSGNVSILKGSRDADETNRFLVALIRSVLKKHRLPVEICTLLPPEREATLELLQAVGWVEVIIPRGSQDLIRFVRENSKVPVIETGAGICHTYFDESGDREKGRAIVYNAKTRRVSVCNALDCLIIHEKRLPDLPYLCSKLPEQNVVLYADEKAYRSLDGNYPSDLLKKATPESFGTEFLDYKLSVRTVKNPEEALEHISHYSSRHSEAIISEDAGQIDRFQQSVDAACVYANVSTAFTDGAQFGLGAEIGISTQKLHARGPMGLEELTSYKYLIGGDGQIREK